MVWGVVTTQHTIARIGMKCAPLSIQECVVLHPFGTRYRAVYPVNAVTLAAIGLSVGILDKRFAKLDARLAMYGYNLRENTIEVHFYHA